MKEEVDAAVKKVLAHVPAAHVMAYFEASLMRQMMERLGHNQSQVAHALNLNRTTLRRRLAAYDIIEVRPRVRNPSPRATLSHDNFLWRTPPCP